MPASRSARATTFAPRSWPSSPGLATSTRILRVPGCFAAGSVVPAPVMSSENGRFGVLAPDLAQRVAHLAQRRVGPRGLEDRVHQVVGAARGALQPSERLAHPR